MKGPYDYLFNRFSSNGQTAEQWANFFASEKELDEGRLHHQTGRVLRKFRNLDKEAQVAAIKEYWVRFPPPETWEEKDKREKAENPLKNVFLWDYISPGAGLYDCAEGDFILKDGLEGHLSWQPIAPWAFRAFVPFPLSNVSDIPKALLKLAIGQSMAFKCGATELLQWKKKYKFVLMPKGDTRTKHLACETGGATEVEGLPHGISLLFHGDGEDNGMVVQCLQSPFCYGIRVWGRFYALQIEEET